MSKYRIVTIFGGHFLVQRKLLWFWDDMGTFGSLGLAEQWIQMIKDFKPEVLREFN